MAGGCSRSPRGHQGTLPSSAGGFKEAVSSHRGGEEETAQDERSDFWQRVSLDSGAGDGFSTPGPRSRFKTCQRSRKR